jgi:hypothetical protein
MQAPVGTTYEQMDASATVLASIVAPMTGCVLVQQQIRFKAVATPKTAAQIGSAIKRCGVFFFENDDGSRQSLVAIPGILSELLMSDGPGAGVLIDISNSDVADFIELYIDGIWTNPFSDNMSRFVAAYRQSRV